MAEKIIVVDDDPAIRKVMRLRLEQEGYRVHCACSGREAIEIIVGDEEEPDCILLDVNMPGVTGIEMLPDLRDLLPRTPIVMLTAVADLDIGMDAMRKGAFDYLAKPVEKLALLTALTRAFRQRESLLEQARLEKENLRYQHTLERKISQRTEELSEAYISLHATNLDTVQMLAETIEAKDPYTRGHCHRVRALSTHLGRRCGLSENELAVVEYSALLHDVGKIGIPEALLNKSGPLVGEEQEFFRQHPVIGERILSRVAFFEPCLPIVRNHHERWDGLGYPDGLAGEEIPYAVRIVTVADSFDAMTSSRPYRKALPLNTALREMQKAAGKQFDPDIIAIFLEERVFECNWAGEPLYLHRGETDDLPAIG